MLLSSDASKKAHGPRLLLSVTKAVHGVFAQWGMTLAYTCGKAQANGGDLFTLDYLNAAQDYPCHRTPQDVRNSVVLSGIVGIPWDIKALDAAQLGHRHRATRSPDCTAGFGLRGSARSR